MLLPHNTIANLMYTAVPIYEWEPVPPATATPPAPPPAAPAEGSAEAAATLSNASNDDAGETADNLPPSLRLVFKGYRWVAVPVWSLRENPAWDQVNQDQRDEETRRSQERGRQAQRVLSAPGAAAGPQSSDGAIGVPATDGGVE
jgi:hypothetical protein